MNPRARVPLPSDLDVAFATGERGRVLTVRCAARWRFARAGMMAAIALAFAVGAAFAPSDVDTLLALMSAPLAAFAVHEAVSTTVTVADASTVRRSARPIGRTTVVPRAAIGQIFSGTQRGDQTNVSMTISSGGATDSFGRTVAPPTWQKTLIEPTYATDFVVRARLKDGTVHLIAGPFAKQDHAIWVEQELERVLRLVDEDVDGELPRA